MALITLFVLFFMTLLYMFLVPLCAYYTYTRQSVVGALLFFGVALSPFMARRPWKALGETNGFEAWRRYFYLRVHKEARFTQSKNVLLCCVPHGLFPLTLPMLSSISNDIFPEFEGRIPRTAVATGLWWSPVLSPLLVWLGCIPARKEEMRHHLKHNTVIVLPDGIAGAFHSQRDEECVYVEQRKGFVKLAIEEGALLVPVYCFGHSQLYDVFPRHDSWLARFSRRIQFSIIWFWGEPWCPPMPRRVPLLVAVGEGIQVMQDSNPTRECIEKVHTLFKQQLGTMYLKHRDQVPGYENKELIIL